MKTVRVIAIACLIALLVAACGDDAAPSKAGGQSGTPDQVTGLITKVEAHMGKHVTAFTLESEDGETYDISIASKVDYGFNLKHLIEHRDAKDPVSVTLEERRGTLYAMSIEDA
ncbi:MAG: hypothetical protein M3391_01390 [Actinomycetota bacterium]|nr:hypothetical protein [Actinomycetota bacterium]